MDLVIELGKTEDVNEIEKLYNDLNDYLEKGINYPGWKKDVYPIRETAEIGVMNKNLYVARNQGKIVGSILLTHEPEAAYKRASWLKELDYSEIYVIHTFVVHPDYQKTGVGKSLMDFALQQAKEHQMKSIRLDVYENNTPAIKLYENCGYVYIDTVDLGLGDYGLDYFKLYELII